MPREARVPEMDDRARFQPMRDAAREAVAFAELRTRDDLGRHHILRYALVHCIQVIGEAAPAMRLGYA